MAIFQNPNDPIQPQRGVYGWYAKSANTMITIYIGEAGKKDSLLPKGTLFRGVSELQRNTFTSNSPDYNSLDTDFIVGTALKFFEEKGFTCIWKHLSNNPHDELKFVIEQKPILQNGYNTNIKNEFRIRTNEKHYWKQRKSQTGIQEAQEKLFRMLELIAN
jgi:hypothetical protein